MRLVSHLSKSATCDKFSCFLNYIECILSSDKSRALEREKLIARVFSTLPKCFFSLPSNLL